MSCDNFYDEDQSEARKTGPDRVTNWRRDTIKSQILVLYQFSYFWLETVSYELISVLSRASKQNDVEIRGTQSKKKNYVRFYISHFFPKYESTKLSTVRKFVILQVTPTFLFVGDNYLWQSPLWKKNQSWNKEIGVSEIRTANPWSETVDLRTWPRGSWRFRLVEDPSNFGWVGTGQTDHSKNRKKKKFRRRNSVIVVCVSNNAHLRWGLISDSGPGR